MKKTPVNCISEPLPPDAERLIAGARIFDSSCSPEARVYFIDRDGGYYLKLAERGTLARGRELTAETVDKCHRVGFSVRAWGIANEEIMKRVYDAGADGMTVNFPDKLIDYIASVTPAAEGET